MKKLTAVLLALIFTLSGLSVSAYAAEETTQAPICKLSASGKTINGYEAENGEFYFFVPGSLKAAFENGYTLSVEAGDDVYCDGVKAENGVATLGKADGTLTCSGVDYKCHVMFTSEIPSVYINTESGSMDNVNADKSNREGGTIIIADENGEAVYDGALDYIKGRGNSTWNMKKKPYNIKLAKKTNLFGMGKSKKWSLIANCEDFSNVRNALAYYAADALGMPYTPKFVFCDVYTNGDYQGLYMLVTRIETDSKRVDIQNLDDINEEIAVAVSGDEDFDMDTLPRGGSYAEYSGLIENTKKWVEIPQAPSGMSVDNTGGYILEAEISERYNDELCGFVTTRSQSVTLKSPEYASKAQVKYISDLYQRFEDAVASENGKNSLGEHYSDIADIDSLALYYIINEWASNMDAGLTSTYFYKPEGENEKLYAGPVWDFDIAFANNDGDRFGCDYKKPEEFTVCFGRLYRNTIFGKWDVDYKPTIYNMLCKRSDFVEHCKKLWDNGVGDTLKSVVNEYIPTLEAQITESAVANATRWNNYGLLDNRAVRARYTLSVNEVEIFASRKAEFLGKNIGDIQVQKEVKDQFPPIIRAVLTSVNNLAEKILVMAGLA